MKTTNAKSSEHEHNFTSFTVFDCMAVFMNYTTVN